ncbi:MAG: ABC transporter substrate-binding protein [Hyphomicrobiaceae bacterium]|nr:ABC transporter substrate-binding protein [Hyphomicrobiaceae bacterium]
MQFRRALTIALAGLASIIGVAALAQDARKAARNKLNENTVFLAGGTAGATFNTLANEIALVVSDDNLRVVAVSTSNAVQNVRDLVYLRSIDVAFTKIDVLNRLQTSGELGPDLKRQIVYIAPLTTEEFHILARPEIKSVEDLKGKKVSFHILGGSVSTLATEVFETLGIKVEAIHSSQPEAIAKMRRKELDATICVCAKVVSAYLDVKPEEGFRFLDVPYLPAMEAVFLPGKITDEDYPNVLAKDTKVNTIAVYNMLVTLNWPKGSERYNRTARFVDAFFSKREKFLKPPWQKSWKEVNFAGKVPGWKRFAPAQEWLDRREREASKTGASFGQSLDDKAGPAGQGRGVPQAENERVFREFLEWSRKRGR